MEWSELRTILLNMLVTVPACVTAWHVRMASNIHKRMAITAIQTELLAMDFMRKWNWLRRFISDSLSLWRCVVSYSNNYPCPDGAKAKCDLKRK
jgi:hypothetical protein